MGEQTDIPMALRMRGFDAVCNPGFGRGRSHLRGAVGSAIQYQAIGVVAQPIEGCRSEQAVGGEGLVPLGEVQVAGDDGGGCFVALGDEVVQVFVGGGSKRFQAEVIDDQKRHTHESGQAPLVAAGGP